MILKPRLVGGHMFKPRHIIFISQIYRAQRGFCLPTRLYFSPHEEGF